jgi:SNF2 family DNA or RNA helicase
MKTEGYSHQKEGLRRLLASPTEFALASDQGTGKTWMLLAEFEARDDLSGALVVAPKGVHANWVRQEVPKHFELPITLYEWDGSASAKESRRRNRFIDSLDRSSGKALAAINYESLITPRGLEFARRFLASCRASIILDESHRIANPGSRISECLGRLRQLAASRRIASGTMFTNSPASLFSQYSFLRPGCLGTDSYRSFVAEYTQLLPPDHPIVVSIMNKTRARFPPQIAAKDESGRPIFRNFDRLARLAAPLTYRVNKDDVLDLPPKVRQVYSYKLSPRHMRAYELAAKDLQLDFGDGRAVTSFEESSRAMKLRQVLSGFALIDGEARQFDAPSDKIRLFESIIESDPFTPTIIWVAFREEVSLLDALLRKACPTAGVVSYYGDTSDEDRAEAIRKFQTGSARFFIAHPAAAGTGLTLTAARRNIYFSNTYSRVLRAQSEDRSHRIGTNGSVLFIDLVAERTIEAKILDALVHKNDAAAEFDSLLIK